MKKFWIISAVLLLLSGGVFGFSLYHYMQVSTPIFTKPAATTATPDEAAPVSETQAAPAAAAADTSGGIFADYFDKAKADVENMSDEELAGQMILGVCSSISTASEDLNTYHLAGFLFQSTNFDYMTSDDVTSKLNEIKTGASIRPILAADEEGGYRNTISGHDAFAEYVFDSPRNLYEAGGLAEVEKVEEQKIDLLAGLGFNLNLAPDIDLANEFNQIMYSRSLCGDANITAKYAEFVTKKSQAKGVSVTLKHFPGYGTIPDSYEPIDTDTRDAETIKSADLVPFKSGVDAGAHFVMVSNVVVQAFDANHTAAFSPSIHQMLRSDLGFTGVIMTNVLDETDYSAYTGGKATAVAAIEAGNDLILVNDYATAYSDVLSAIQSGTLSKDTVKSTVARIIAYKYANNIIK